MRCLTYLLYGLKTLFHIQKKIFQNIVEINKILHICIIFMYLQCIKRLKPLWKNHVNNILDPKY
jgi:hypothetical protein